MNIYAPEMIDFLLYIEAVMIMISVFSLCGMYYARNRGETGLSLSLYVCAVLNFDILWTLSDAWVRQGMRTRLAELFSAVIG